MTMIKTNYKLSNNEFTTLNRLAKDYLKYYGVSEFPIKILDLIGYRDDLKVMTYGEYARINNMSFKDVIMEKNSNEGCLEKVNSIYIIYFNERLPIRNKRWTLAHELSHYLLKHLDSYELQRIEEVPIYKSLRLNKNVPYDKLEAEANFLAKNILVPFPVLNKIIDFWGGITIDQIKNVFNINYEPSKYIKNNIDNVRRWSISVSDEILEYRFSTCINNLANVHYCTKCGREFNHKSYYCGICGSSDTFVHLQYDAVDIYNDFFRRDLMKFKGIDVDENSKAISCPVCDNEEVNFDGEHCIICGTHLVNRCSISNTNSFDECGIELPGNARFCHMCGNKSTYYIHGLLTSFEDIVSEKDIDDFVKSNTSGFYTIGDDDIPF